MIIIEAYFGDIIYSITKDKLELKKNSYILVENGRVVEVLETLKKEYEDIRIHNYSNKLIIPSFVDLHFHAPQFENIGLGLDEKLIPWLKKYTFLEEKKFSNLEYAQEVYKRVINEIWKQGTTRIVFFGTVHLEATSLLLELLAKSGLGGYVGKVNMDRNSPSYLIEDSKKSYDETISFMEKYKETYDIVKPIITPRFVPSCTKELMEKLGLYAKTNNFCIQTHLSENNDEIKWVNELHTECNGYLDVYKETSLLQKNTVFAHCIYNTEAELDLLKKSNCYIAHCPTSNLNLSSGIMPLRKYLDLGLNIGLGTDIGAGHNTSIKSEIIMAINSSKAYWLNDKNNKPLTISEAFYLATKGGGEFFGKVGSFLADYEFDALVIDDSSITLKGTRTLFERLERFLYCGDDRQIEKRFVRGVEIKKPF